MVIENPLTSSLIPNVNSWSMNSDLVGPITNRRALALGTLAGLPLVLSGCSENQSTQVGTSDLVQQIINADSSLPITGHLYNADPALVQHSLSDTIAAPHHAYRYSGFGDPTLLARMKGIVSHSETSYDAAAGVVDSTANTLQNHTGVEVPTDFLYGHFRDFAAPTLGGVLTLAAIGFILNEYTMAADGSHRAPFKTELKPWLAIGALTASYVLLSNSLSTGHLSFNLEEHNAYYKSWAVTAPLWPLVAMINFRNPGWFFARLPWTKKVHNYGLKIKSASADPTKRGYFAATAENVDKLFGIYSDKETGKVYRRILATLELEHLASPAALASLETLPDSIQSKIQFSISPDDLASYRKAFPKIAQLPGISTAIDVVAQQIVNKPTQVPFTVATKQNNTQVSANVKTGSIIDNSTGQFNNLLTENKAVVAPQNKVHIILKKDLEITKNDSVTVIKGVVHRVYRPEPTQIENFSKQLAKNESIVDYKVEIDGPAKMVMGLTAVAVADRPMTGDNWLGRIFDKAEKYTPSFLENFVSSYRKFIRSNLKPKNTTITLYEETDFHFQRSPEHRNMINTAIAKIIGPGQHTGVFKGNPHADISRYVLDSLNADKSSPVLTPIQDAGGKTTDHRVTLEFYGDSESFKKIRDIFDSIDGKKNQIIDVNRSPENDNTRFSVPLGFLLQQFQKAHELGRKIEEPENQKLAKLITLAKKRKLRIVVPNDPIALNEVSTFTPIEAIAINVAAGDLRPKDHVDFPHLNSTVNANRSTPLAGVGEFANIIGRVARYTFVNGRFGNIMGMSIAGFFSSSPISSITKYLTGITNPATYMFSAARTFGSTTGNFIVRPAVMRAVGRENFSVTWYYAFSMLFFIPLYESINDTATDEPARMQIEDKTIRTTVQGSPEARAEYLQELRTEELSLAPHHRESVLEYRLSNMIETGVAKDEDVQSIQYLYASYKNNHDARIRLLAGISNDDVWTQQIEEQEPQFFNILRHDLLANRDDVSQVYAGFDRNMSVSIADGWLSVSDK